MASTMSHLALDLKGAYDSPSIDRPGKVRSLVELCIKTLAINIEEASVEALEHLPVALLWRVYKYYITYCHETIRGWRLFSPILLRELSRVPLGLYWHRWQERTPDHQDLPRYIELSTSSRVDFITHLTIHKVWMFRASDLMALAEMPNLGILELSDLFGSAQDDRDFIQPDRVDSLLSDRLVRGWSEKDNPFPNLRILMLTSVHSSVTLLTLQYATRFPLLVYCVLQSISLSREKHGIKQRAANLGWRLERTLRPWKQAAMDPGWFSGFPGFFSRSIKAPDRIKAYLLQEFERDKRAGVFISRYQPTDSEADIPNEAPVEEHGVAEPRGRHLWFPSYRPYWSWIVWNLYGTLGEQIGNADILDQGVELPYRATHMAPMMRCKNERRYGETVQGLGGCYEIFPPKQMLSVVLGCPPADYPDVEDRKYRPGDYLGFSGNFGLPGEAPGVKLKSYTFVRDYNLNMSTSTGTGGANTANTAVSGEPQSSKEAGLPNFSTRRTEAGGAATFRPRKRRNLNDLFSYGAESKEDGTL